MAKYQKKFRPVFWLTGNYYDSQKNWRAIVEMLKDPNVVVLEGGSQVSDPRVAKAADVIRLLKNKDLFDSRPRVLKLKGLPGDYHLLIDYLKLVNNDNVLVIDGPFGYKNSDGKFVTAKTSKFYKTIASEGKILEAPMEAESDRAAKDWVVKVCGELGKKIESAALETLIQYRGRNLDILYSDLTCLVMYQTGKSIQDADVREICLPLFLKTVWELIEKIDRQDYESACANMQEFYAKAGSEVGTTFYGDVAQLLGALHRHFEFNFYVSNLKLPLRYDAVAEAVKGVKKRTKKDEKYVWEDDKFSSGYIYTAIRKPELQSILSWPREKLLAVMVDLMRTMTICRTKYTSDEEAIKLCLDTFLMTACGRMSYERSSELKGYRRWVSRV